jgi:5-methylcytosine-specific restriction endonuclease McrA
MAGRWYSKQQWVRRRAHQLRHHPLCAMCLARGTLTPATVADHVVPHKGDSQQFWFGKLQSLCKHCHDGTKHSIEDRERRYGYRPGYGSDGWPVDSRHPCYRKG